jgi:hypothetical protein
MKTLLTAPPKKKNKHDFIAEPDVQAMLQMSIAAGMRKPLIVNESIRRHCATILEETARKIEKTLKKCAKRPASPRPLPR